MISLLIVDDEMHLVDSLAETLDWVSIGIDRVIGAYSAQEALDAMRAEQIDIVITDIRMPEMDGLELIGQIRRTWPQIKLALLTGHADFNYARQALRHQVGSYLIKPAADEEILSEIGQLAAQLKQEWEAIASMEKAQFAMRENLPLIQHHLLTDLLQGKPYSAEGLDKKLHAYRIPFRPGQRFSLMAIRMEHGFPAADSYDQSLYEYAVGNIVSEILSPDFVQWRCVDEYDFLIFMIGMKEDDGGEWPGTRLAELGVRIQHQVKTYLKGSVSLVVGRVGSFPEELTAIYRETLIAVRHAVGSESSVFFSIGDKQGELPVMKTVRALYEQPALPFLLEVGNWELAEQRLEAVFDELFEHWSASQEQLLEVQSFLVHTFTYLAHRNGQSFAEMAGDSYQRVLGGGLLHSARSLREWARGMTAHLRRAMDSEMRDTRQELIRKACSFIESNLNVDVTLPAIADHVHLHPVYLSRIFKQLTGDNISDYIHRIRMEKAAYLLKNTELKVYEITELVGYENPQYFSKVFRKHYEQTPLEYRDTESRPAEQPASGEGEGQPG